VWRRADRFFHIRMFVRFLCILCVLSQNSKLNLKSWIKISHQRYAFCLTRIAAPWSDVFLVSSPSKSAAEINYDSKIHFGLSFLVYCPDYCSKYCPLYIERFNDPKKKLILGVFVFRPTVVLDGYSQQKTLRFSELISSNISSTVNVYWL